MASELDNLRQCVLDAVEDKRREISDPVIYLCGIQRTQSALIGALESRLAECQERERKLREACEAADTHVALESVVFPSPIFWDDIQKIKTQLSAALEVKK